MHTVCDALDILKHLAAHPSRSSALTIGADYVLNGAAVTVAEAGLRALRSMPCRETIDTLSRVAVGPQQAPSIVIHAVSAAKTIVKQAIAGGYTKLARAQLRDLARTAASRASGAQAEGNLAGCAGELLAHAYASLQDLGTLPDF